MHESPRGLSCAHMLVLGCLYGEPPVSPQEIARSLELPVSTVEALCEDLVKAGLIEPATER